MGNSGIAPGKGREKKKGLRKGKKKFREEL